MKTIKEITDSIPITQKSAINYTITKVDDNDARINIFCTEMIPIYRWKQLVAKIEEALIQIKE
jgi:hypothetical protein